MTLLVGILVYPQFELLDAAGPASAFASVQPFAEGLPRYAIHLLSERGGLVESSAGVAVQTGVLAGAPSLDTVIVAGGAGSRSTAVLPPLVAFLRERAVQCRRVASVCTGAFVLAASGLLDGRRATTHWEFAAMLAQRFPLVQVEADRIWVRDGNFWTSAGIAAGIDLTLALIADDYGEALSKRVAQELVVYYRRPGGQSQFSALLELDRPDGRFSKLLGWIRQNLAASLTVTRLAEEAAMSERNFARSFRAEIGITPAKAIEQLRLEAARGHAEAGIEPMDQIARITGFGDPERMRCAFLRAFGQPPQALRRIASRAQRHDKAPGHIGGHRGSTPMVTSH